MATEHERRAQLNANRNRIDARLQKRALQDVAQPENNSEYDDATREYSHKRNLSLLKAGANAGVKQLDKQGGALAGEIAGGWLGSAIPFVGTAIGTFLGRFFGKKLGITGILLASFLVGLFILVILLIIFLIVFQGYCKNFPGIDKLTLGVCQSLSSIQNAR